jgi:hypothetical protein
MLSSTTIHDIITHLGGEARLAAIGAREFFADKTHLSFKLLRPNPKHIHSVTISVQPNGLFDMDCYGPITPDAFSAPRVASSSGIVADNLATVLGRLTGIESLHHRHF